MTPKKIHNWIAEAAYFNSLKRETIPGQELQDWLEAEYQYRKLAKKRVKSGLVSIDLPSTCQGL